MCSFTAKLFINSHSIYLNNTSLLLQSFPNLFLMGISTTVNHSASSSSINSNFSVLPGLTLVTLGDLCCTRPPRPPRAAPLPLPLTPPPPLALPPLALPPLGATLTFGLAFFVAGGGVLFTGFLAGGASTFLGGGTFSSGSCSGSGSSSASSVG